MSMVSTLSAQQPEYHFPLLSQTASSGDSHGSNFSPRANANHSRQYTVGFLADEQKMQQSALLAPSRGSLSVSAKPSSARHAHKRSAAVSHDFTHDFGLDRATIEKLHQSGGGGGGPAGSPAGQTHSNAIYSLQSPALTFSSSSSSLPFQSTNSLVSSNTSLPDTIAEDSSKNKGDVQLQQPEKSQKSQTQPKVSFALTSNLRSSSSYRSHLGSGVDNCVISNDVVQCDDRRPMTRHKKMKSWAGNLIRFRSSSKKDSKKQQAHMMGATDNNFTNFTSSSYVPAEELHQPATDVSSPREPEPRIDLDAALGPFRTPHTLGSVSNSSDGFFSFNQHHRRSESAPEISQAPGIRGMKRKMGPVMEEDSIEEAADGDNSSSVVSLVSSSRLSTKSSGYSRNYKNALCALSAASLNSYNSSQSSLNCNSSCSDSDSQRETLSSSSSKKKHVDDSTTAVADTIIGEINENVKRSDNISFHYLQTSVDDSIATITPSQSKRTKSIVSDPIDFGEPGPEIRMSLDSVNMSISSVHSKSNRTWRSQDSISSSIIGKHNMAKRAWRWVRNRVSGDSLQDKLG